MALPFNRPFKNVRMQGPLKRWKLGSDEVMKLGEAETVRLASGLSKL
jgi:hypothetical protein